MVSALGLNDLSLRVHWGALLLEYVAPKRLLVRTILEGT